MAMYNTTFSRIYCPLLFTLFSTSTFARYHSSRLHSYQKLSPIHSLASNVPTSMPLSEVDTSSAINIQILAARDISSIAIAARLCRGGYQGKDDMPFGHQSYSRNNDEFHSNEYGNDNKYNYEDNYPCDDRGSSYDDRGKGNRLDPASFSMPDIIRTGNRKIGLPLLAIGGALTMLGVSLFFNKTLMRLGNLFFVAGVPATLGPGRTAGYFFQPKKARATACLAVGVMLVFIGWPIFGIILEAFGLLNLFGNMFPMALMILKQMPVIGPLLKGNNRSNNSNKDIHSDRSYRNDNYDSYHDDRDMYKGDDPYYDDRRYQDDNSDNRYF